jgi:SAM-dependent methyltransferase
MRHLLLPFIPALFFRVIVAIAQETPFPSLINHKLASEVTTDLILVALGWLIVQFSRTWGVRTMMRSVYAIAAVTQDPKRAFQRNYAASEIRRVRGVVEQLVQGTYRAENPEELKRWFDALFNDGGDWYRAVDSNPPSAYMQDYAWYLNTHAKGRDGRAGNAPNRDIRVLTTTRDDLTSDYARFTGMYGAYYDWHSKHHVKANWIALEDVERLRQKYSVGHADVGLWEKHAVLFTPDEHSDAVTISVYVPGEAGDGGPSYAQITEYVNEVIKQSEDLGDVAPRLELVDQDLADNWETYVEPRSREQGPFGQFLRETLNGRQYVLDAAAGIGSDSVFLLDEGFTVWSNEVDVRLAEVASSYAARRKVPLHLTSYLWETLPESFAHEGNMRFDAVLVLGNSLCLVKEATQRRICLDAFHDVLRPGGLLIIDERNFAYLLDFAKEIMRDPVGKFPPTVEGDVMYGGKGVRGYPADISEQRILWRFFDNVPPIAGSRASIVERQFNVRDLSLYPFRHGELHRLLRGRFENIRVFADMVEVTDGASMPPAESIGNAAFVTYVAMRPHDGATLQGHVDLGGHRQGPGA